MTRLPILYPENKSVRDFLKSEYCGITFKKLPHGEITSIILWRIDGIGVAVFNEMADIADRIEIGRLKFCLTKEKSNKDILVNFSINEDTAIKLYSIKESNFIAESGISFSIDGKEILIISSSFPAMLAFRYSPLEDTSFAPEYPLENYIVTNI